MSDALNLEATYDSDADEVDRSRLPFSLLLELDVRDPDTIAELVRHGEGGEREHFALDALRIGVLALKQARGQIDADLVRRESERLLGDLATRLDGHSRLVNDTLTRTLKDYFDPESGRFEERVNRLIKQDGELEGILRRQIGSDDSQLARTLATHFGADSPLLKWLSPDQSQGLMAALRETLENQLQVQREHVLSQFSLDNKESALTRFISELTDHQGKFSEQLQGKIDEAVREFSLDDETSALSGLVRRVTEAQKTITSEFSLDEEKSALSKLKRILENTNEAIESHLSLDVEDSALARLKRELLKLHEEHHEVNRKFQEEVRETLQAMIIRKKEAARSTTHGIEFEEAVYEHLSREAQRYSDVAERCGSSTGQIKNCKTGDCILVLGPECLAGGARIVLEAKEVAGYSLTDARAEIEQARQNRDAQVGVFVFSRKFAPEGIEPLSRFGNDVMIIWDAEDATSDLYFRAGLSLARALCVRNKTMTETQKVDFQEIDRAILEIEKRSMMLEEIDKWAATIKNNGEKIIDRVRTSRAALEKQVGILREKTDELKASTEAGEAEEA
ncbi:MAG: hypothetical protein AB7O26_00105 [Planctomycetaceae bacterium]